MSLEEIYKVFRDRLVDPIIGSYIVPLLILNWKVWLMVWSGDESSNSRIQKLDEYFSSSDFHFTFLHAFVVFLIYLFVLPFIQEIFLWVRRLIIVIQYKNTQSFEDRLAYEKSLGGNVKVLAAGLQYELHRVSIQTEALLNMVDSLMRDHKIPNSNNFVLSKQNAESVLNNAKQMMNLNDDLFDVNKHYPYLHFAEKCRKAREKRLLTPG